jgi:taurine dioxygenase
MALHMRPHVTPQDAPCGAVVRGVNLSQPLDAATSAAIRSAWLQHQVLAFVDQAMTLEDLERFALTIGPYGQDPYFESVPGHPHVAQVKREADETSTLFADNFHSDWSFLPSPPAATLLYGDVIPPVGGDTLFANQYDAWDALSPPMRALLQGKQGVHSARRGYAKAGRYGEGTRAARWRSATTIPPWPRSCTPSAACTPRPAAPRCSSAPATPSASMACPTTRPARC